AGWYGSPGVGPGAGRGRGKAAPAGAPAGNEKEPPAPAAQAAADGAAGRGKGAFPGFGGGNQPANLRELSEKDAMNVLAMVRKEFKIDDKRIYIMGHSMGGAGALYL